jgi:hypothetical protein
MVNTSALTRQQHEEGRRIRADRHQEKQSALARCASTEPGLPKLTQQFRLELHLTRWQEGGRVSLRDSDWQGTSPCFSVVSGGFRGPPKPLHPLNAERAYS